MISYYGHHIGIRPSSLRFSLYYKHYKLDDQAHPYLDLYCILVIAQKVFERKVLFQPFEHGLYLPAIFVDIGDLVGLQFIVIGNELIYLALLLMPKSYPSQVKFVIIFIGERYFFIL